MIFKTPTVYSGDINESLNVKDEPSLGDQVINLENVYKDDEPFIQDNPNNPTNVKISQIYKDVEKMHTRSKSQPKPQTPENLKLIRSQSLKKKSSNK